MPPIPYKRPDYMDPSVTDSWWTWAKRQVGTLVGADDPAGSVMGMVGAVEVPKGPVEALVSQLSTKPRAVLKAYHGSPHDFEKFSLDKIGTGEGAQAYGHGLYFAENEGTARSYRDSLINRAADSHTPQGAAERALGISEDREGAIRTLESNLNEIRRIKDRMGVHTPAEFAVREGEYEEAIRLVKGGYKPGGRMYEVNLNVSPDELLDWDKPLGEQPEAVQNAVLGKSGLNEFIDPYTLTGENAYQRMVTQAGGRSGHTEGLASKRLKEAGIKGIKYLDAGSRTAGEGTRNFVVFDDSLITIARKYGIPLAVLAGPTGRAMVDALAKRDAQQQAAQEKVSRSRARYLPNR